MIPLILLLAAADPFADTNAKAVVLIFTRADCPVSNRYAPEVTRIYSGYSNRGVKFWLVYPDRDATLADIEKHRAAYNYPIPAVQDRAHRLVARARAIVTPEAAVFIPAPGKGWQLVYRGRIDDRYVDFGKYRPAAERHDLEEVLGNVLAGKPLSFRETKAIGCAIADLR